VDPVLDVGCGKRKAEPGAFGIDSSPSSAADTVWDLDQYPWPLESDQFVRIHMSHVLEHLDDPMRAMAEVYRMARDGADVFITTPHFSSHNSYTDPTHKRHLAAASFAYFTGQDFATFAGSPFRFDIVEVRLTFGGNLVLDNIGRALAGLSLKWYERHAAWIFPALDIRCHLRARKSANPPAR
jgi:SAM-dependent methyltransferase